MRDMHPKASTLAILKGMYLNEARVAALGKIATRDDVSMRWKSRQYSNLEYANVDEKELDYLCIPCNDPERNAGENTGRCTALAKVE